MVFLNKISEKITINRHFPENCVKITLTNRFTNDTLEFKDLQDSSESIYFYEFTDIDMSALIDGEYFLSLYDENDKLIETMLAVCGDYKKVRTQYEKQNNSRKVYERE